MAPAVETGGRDFLTEVTITVPADVAPEEVERLTCAETQRAAELAADGYLLRLWRPVGPGWRNIGIWHADDEAGLRAIMATLPLSRWMTINVRSLDSHPNDPAAVPQTPADDPEARRP